MESVMVGNWQVNYFCEPVVAMNRIEQQAQELIAGWLSVFPKEETWVQQNYRIPSLLLKLDYFEQNGKIQLCEIEDRPDGIGVVSLVNQDFAKKLSALKCKWPCFSSVVSDQRKICDDYLWLGRQISLAEALENDDLILARCEPAEADFHVLQARSVSTIKTEGMKCYGEKMQLWRRMSSENLDQLDWDSGFVCKPIQGSKSQGVEIFHPKRKRLQKDGYDGVSSRSRIEERFFRAEGFVQEFMDPQRISIGTTEYLKLNRLYFGFDPEFEHFVCLGGQIVASRNFVIHGSDKGFIMPLVIDQSSSSYLFA